jgi:transposase-like protein
MREMDFSEKNVVNRWMGVNSIWSAIQGEMKALVKVRLERALALEVTQRVGCGRYERSVSRSGYRNGEYARDLLTSYGWIEGLRVPRLREGGIETEVFERYHRRSRVIDRTLLEAFLLGHATRKTARLFRRLFGSTLSAQTISGIVRELDGEVAGFHNRSLAGEYRAVYLDGVWVTLSKPVKMKKVVLVALGAKADGSKELLSFQVAPLESEACWWGFISDLKRRGLGGMEVIVSDAQAGLVKAIRALYPRVAHQLCTFHKAMDLGDHLAEKRHRNQITADARHVFEAQSESETRERLRRFGQKWSAPEPRAVRNFFRDIDACLIYQRYDEPWRTSLKTNNPIERYLEEIRRRIIPMRSFNNTRSVERIIYGIIAYVLNDPTDMPNTQFTQFA